MNVADVMTHEVISVQPGASLKEAARLLVEHRISGVPVVDHQGRVLGVLSEADVLVKEAANGHERRPLAWLTGQQPADRGKLDARVVGEAMTSPALTIEASRPLVAAARMMTEHRVNRLPVVKEDKLVGLVTRADLVRAFVRTDAEIAEEIREDVVVRSMWLERHSVEAEVADGEVTLTGTVGSHADAVLLEALVARVAGVVGVHSQVAWTDEG